MRTKVKVGGFELLQAVLEGLSSTSMVAVVELRGEEDGLPGNTRGLDTLANLGFVTVGGSGVNVLVAVLEGMLDGLLYSTRLGFPGA